jgi:hypothetical protein
MVKYKLCWNSTDPRTGDVDIPASAMIIGTTGPAVWGESNRERTMSVTILYLIEANTPDKTKLTLRK